MDSKSLLADKKYQDILNASFDKHRNELKQKFDKDLASLEQSRVSHEHYLNSQLYGVIEGIKEQSRKDGVPDGFTYRQTTWGFGPLKESQVAEIIATQFDPNIKISVKFSDSQDCGYIHVTLSESQTTRYIRAKKTHAAKEKKRQDLLKQLRTLDK